MNLRVTLKGGSLVTYSETPEERERRQREAASELPPETSTAPPTEAEGAEG